ncbi:ABC transporter ATP-binding protein [Treponema sp. OMZ 787]|uniref:ABC transporter ATP-binding protein n=1 Tax=Treponema sp. OMZ 787 TaxID=2563669 RepID=UPI0020A5CFC9|nr:ABC transporter ATP-binding protein [Treponema sp. OMZ 787]UTC62508.1 ABC transporter ATP-binding protein [Treponema sp. OMZ 787]
MKTQSNAILKAENINTSIKINKKNYLALRNISFSLYKNEILAVVGESGSGKTILMKTLIGLLPENGFLESGKIILNDNDITELSQKNTNTIRGKKISMIFQDQETSLNPLRTVGFHLTEILRRYSALNKIKAKEKTINLLSAVGIDNPSVWLNKYPHELSGGMRQRVLIAMALASNSQIIIADEPTTALDVTVQAQILELLKTLKQSNKSMFFITHDLSIAASICDRILVMYGSRIMEEMFVDDLFSGAKHPYTQALLKTIPIIGEKPLERFTTIPGTAPSLETIEDGCPFYSRCSLAKEICKKKFPEIKKVSEGHYYYCHQ